MGDLPPGSFLPQILFFGDLNPHAKFRNPTITPSGRKVTAGERRKKEREKNAFNSEHFVPRQRTQAARANYCCHPYYVCVCVCDLFSAYLFYTFFKRISPVNHIVGERGEKL